MSKSALMSSLLILGLSACLASTNLTSMVRPNWDGSRFDRIAVYYSSSDLGARKHVEDRFAKSDSMFVPTHELFFPGESHTPEDIRTVIEKNQIQAILVVLPEGSGSNTAILPGQTRTSCVGSTCTTTGGPIAATFPHADFGASLVKWDNGETIWTATAQSGGNAFADQGNLRENLVDTVIEHLRQDGVISSSARHGERD